MNKHSILYLLKKVYYNFIKLIKKTLRDSKYLEIVLSEITRKPTQKKTENMEHTQEQQYLLDQRIKMEAQFEAAR